MAGGHTFNMDKDRLHSSTADYDEQLCCPLCGSLYLVSSKSGGAAVFQVFDRLYRLITLLQPGSNGEEAINRRDISCGACSWRGDIDQLVVSTTA